METNQKKSSSKKLNRIIIISLVAVLLILAVVIISIIIGRSEPKNSSVLVYNKDNAAVVRIDGYSVELSDKSASGFVADEENKRVFYTVDSSHTDNLYDLCYVYVKDSEISQPVIIDYAVKSNFSISDGKVYYLKYNKTQDAFEGYVCDLAKKTQTCFDINLDNIYPLSGTDVIYYTKYHANTLSLYKYTDGPENSLLYSEIKTAYAYNDCDKPHILFETSQEHTDSLTDLRLIYADGEFLLCDSTYYVDYDRYEQGENLYYYASPKNSVSWSYVISDSFVETDKEIVKPNRDDYESEMGVSADYNEDYIKYQDKLIRDEIRTALNNAVAESGFNAPVYSVFAYNSDNIYKVAENIDPSRVFAVSKKGTPKIIFDNTVLTSADVDMSSLVSISLRNNLDEVISYAWSVLDNNVYSKGIYLASCVEGKPEIYPLDAYSKESTLFSFSQNGERIFAFVKDDNLGSTGTLYCNNLNKNMSPADSVSVATGVSDYKGTDGSVIYIKDDVGKNTGDVYWYNGAENVKLSNAASAFSLDGEYVAIIKNCSSTDGFEVADYYFSHEGEESLIAENILTSAFRFNDGGKAVYISPDGGVLNVYFEGESDAVDDNVSSIVLFE